MAKGMRRSFWAGLFGNALEWYDFIIYAYYAPIFAKIFFPSQSVYISLLATFGVFGSGFIVRPLGGLLIGRYGDKSGRRKALVLSISLMSVATTLISFLPTYRQIGTLAPILLTLLRLLQGIAVGGELMSSTTYLVEHANERKKGFAASLILSTATMGMLFGSATTTLLTTIFSPVEMLAFGWRVGFLSGGLLGILGIYLRVRSTETPQFLQIENEPQHTLKDLFVYFSKELTLAIIFTSILALGNYILIAYITTFLVEKENFLLRDAMFINFIGLLVLTLLIPLFGILSDHVGRKKVLLLGISLVALFALPLFWLLSSGNFTCVLIGQLLLSIGLAGINAVVPIILVEMFPTSIRATGSAIGYNVGQALFGGTAPLIALILVESTGNKLAPGVYLFACALIAMIAVKFLRTDKAIKSCQI